MRNNRRFYGLRELYEAGFTHTGSKEAGEYGLTRGTCFVARRLELVAVAGPLWISRCALGGAEFFMRCASLFFFFLRKRTHGLLQV